MKDLNCLSAEEIMGWEALISSWNGELWYFSSPESKEAGTPTGGKPIIKVADWTPLTDMNQCMMVDNKMIRSGWSLTLQTFLDCYVAYYQPIERPSSELGDELGESYNAQVVQNEGAGSAIITAALSVIAGGGEGGGNGNRTS